MDEKQILAQHRAQDDNQKAMADTCAMQIRKLMHAQFGGGFGDVARG